MLSNKRLTDILSIVVLNHIEGNCMFLDKKLGNPDIGIINLLFFSISKETFINIEMQKTKIFNSLQSGKIILSVFFSW